MVYNNIKPTKVVGNDLSADKSLGYKMEIKNILEAYAAKGTNLSSSLESIIANPMERQELMDTILESLASDSVLTSGLATETPFYNNYADRVSQLLENSLNAIARESAMLGYAPIVSYAPFFLKKQWVDCVFNNVVMTEIPASPIINLAFEKRYLRAYTGADGSYKDYPIPDVNYDDAALNEIFNASTGLKLDETKEMALPFNANILDATYFPGLVKKPGVELTPNIHIYKVSMEVDGAQQEINTNIKVDITTHNFVNGKVKFDVVDPVSGAITKTVNGEVIGKVDFESGQVTVMSTTAAGDGNISKVWMRATLANRWNERSVETIRKNEQIQFVMPESGPRLNTAVTVEDAADALAIQNIEVIADNVDVMGRTLADLEDFEIRKFLKDSFEAQKASGLGPHGYESLIVEGTFDALPYDGYNGRVTAWMADSKEYFERVVAQLKTKLKTQDAVITVVCHPNLVRFLQDGIQWIMNSNSQVSGLKLSYNVGVVTTSQDKVNIITSMYCKEEDGMTFVLLPLTKELATYKHYKYNVIIDRDYRNPNQPLVPNIMATQRTMTVEVLPVQGNLKIEGRELFSPQALNEANTRRP